MTKYYYNKYNSTQVYIRSAPEMSYLDISYDYEDLYYLMYTDYALDASTGVFSGLGDPLSQMLPLNNDPWFSRKYFIQTPTILYENLGTIRTMTDRDGTMYANKYTSVISYVKGTLIQSNIVAEDGTYPTNGRHMDGYWYVRGVLVFPELKMKINNELKTSENGWVKINGQLREIESIKMRISGTLKEV